MNKNKRIEIRMTEDDVRTLDKICTDIGLTRSEVVRTLVATKYNELIGNVATNVDTNVDTNPLRELPEEIVSPMETGYECERMASQSAEKKSGYQVDSAGNRFIKTVSGKAIYV